MIRTEFRFTNEVSPSKSDEILDYLLGPRLWIPNTDYPDILDWAQKAHTQLKEGSKRAMVAYYGTEIVGVVVYQRHRELAEALELKNVTVRPDLRGRHIAAFLVRNAEIEGSREFESQFVVCDAKADNRAIGLFLDGQHYQVVGRQDLYGLGTGLDVVYRKSIVPPQFRGL